MKINSIRQEPVRPPIISITITLSEDESIRLKDILNYADGFYTNGSETEKFRKLLLTILKEELA